MHVTPLGQDSKPRELAEEQYVGTVLNFLTSPQKVVSTFSTQSTPADWDSLEDSFECSYNFLGLKREPLSILL